MLIAPKHWFQESSASVFLQKIHCAVEFCNYIQSFLVLFLNWFPILQATVPSWALVSLKKNRWIIRKLESTLIYGYDLTWAGFCQQESNENGIKPIQQRKLTNRRLTIADVFYGSGDMFWRSLNWNHLFIQKLKSFSLKNLWECYI